MDYEQENKETSKSHDNNEAILIVEDNRANQALLLQQLTVLGYSADTTTNGQEALDKLTATNYSIILTDLNMPKMDGYQLTHQIRQMEQGNPRHRIIIAITAKALDGEKEKCLQSGMDDYLSKPINIFDLKTLLEKWQSLST